MMNRRDCRQRIAVEALEARLALSSTTPANAIGTSTAIVSQPRAISETTVEVASKNITTQKNGTIFGVFVQPTAGSQLQPKIVAVIGSNGKPLPLQDGRPFRPGVSDEAVVFFKDGSLGAVTIEVTGAGQSTGSYQVQTTLVGDVNGDGTVNFADLQAFAPTYGSQQGNSNYNLAADFNQNGVINLYDAKALLHNMAPLTPRLPLATRLTLALRIRFTTRGQPTWEGTRFSKTSRFSATRRREAW